MQQTVLVIRIILLAFSTLAGLAVWYVFEETTTAWLSVLVGFLLGVFLILVDMLLKGFSLRGLSGLTFGLLMGILASHFISISPLFEGGDPKVIYISRVCVFVSITYLATVIALRGKDEFNLVIPYVRFEPEKVEVPIVVIDSSCLVDGRVTNLCQARLLSDLLYIPKFVVNEMNELSASSIEEEKNRGSRGLKTLAELKELGHVEIKIYDSDIEKGQDLREKTLFVVSSLKGRLLTASESMKRRAEQEGITYIDMLGLGKALTYEVEVGSTVSVKLVKEGKEDSQGVGYLDDGSMVVVNGAADLIGSTLFVEVESIIPTSGGRMVFGKMLGEVS